MIRLTFQKEILDHLLSLRFTVGLVLCLVVSLTAVIILTHDYQRELADYNQRIAMQDDFLNNYAHSLNVSLGRIQSPLSRKGSCKKCALDHQIADYEK